MSTQIEKFKQIADKIREKTNSTEPMTANDFTDKIDDVYNAGQLSMIDASKVIEKTVSGTYAVLLNDVSETPHKVCVTLKSDTTDDFSGISIIKCGKNLFNPTISDDIKGISITSSDDTLTITNSNTSSTTIDWYLRLGAGTYTFTNNNPSGGLTFYFYTRVSETDAWSAAHVVTATSALVKNFDTAQYIRVVMFAGVGQSIFKIPQIEVGNISTEFEPYIGEVYEADTYGTFKEITSISPYMNIIANTDVNMEVTYKSSYGMNTQLNRIWKQLQNYGTRMDYTSAFAYSVWDSDSFKPPYDIRPSSSSGDGSASCLFKYAAKSSTSRLIDLEAVENECGISFDFSTCNNLSFAFADAGALKKLNVVDVRKCNAGERLNYAFYGGYGSNIECINKIICDENSSFANTTFNSMTKLREIRFEGTIGKGGITFASSKNLSHDSIQNIINSLSEETQGLTLTLSAAAINNAFEAAEWEALADTRTNWTISLI